MKERWKKEGKDLRQMRLSIKASPEDVMKKSNLTRLEIGDLEKGIWNSERDRSEAVKLYFESLIEIELGNNKPLLKEIKGFLVEAKSCQK